MSSDVSTPVVAETVGPAVCTHTVHTEAFGDGTLITLETPVIRVQLNTLGAAIQSVQLRRPSDGSMMEVCLGYNYAAECADHSTSVAGVSVGRYAGRIEGGEFTLNGTDYKLLQNEGETTLHGGPGGFQKQQWKYLITEGESEIGVSFHLTSPHLDQGFPGELYVTATYSVLKDAAAPSLKYVYQASLSDTTPVDATVVNLTNHVYWNLNGVPRPSAEAAAAELPAPITNHLLHLNATYGAEIDEALIPRGDMRETAGTKHDYTTLRPILPGMEETRELGREQWGYDDPMALDTWDCTLREAATLYSPQTKLQMKVLTTNPCVVVYTGNHLPEDADGSKGKRFQRHAGIALECQYFPNSPNVDSFPTTVVSKGEQYRETTVHEFKFLAANPTTAATK